MCRYDFHDSSIESTNAKPYPKYPLFFMWNGPPILWCKLRLQLLWTRHVGSANFCGVNYDRNFCGGGQYQDRNYDRNFRCTSTTSRDGGTVHGDRASDRRSDGCP